MLMKDDDPKSFLPDLLEKNKVIAEIGCGKGRYCEELAGFASMLYCIDIDEASLDKTKEKLMQKAGLRFKALTSPSGIKSNAVDLILFANSFHDVEDKKSMQTEASRILKDDGKIIIVDWNKADRIIMGPPQAIRLSEEEYMRHFSGFKIAKRFRVGKHHFGLVLVKK